MSDNPRPSVVASASSSTSGSTIAVGTSTDVALIQSIEKGEFGPAEDDTRSLTDSIRKHIVEGGLRYHAYHAGKYAFPNDETEQYRDDLKHNLTIHLCDGEYFFAPVHRRLEEGAEVLDLGETPCPFPTPPATTACLTDFFSLFAT